jgi:hypothetical protein
VESSEGPKNGRAKLNEKLEKPTEQSFEGTGVTIAVTYPGANGGRSDAVAVSHPSKRQGTSLCAIHQELMEQVVRPENAEVAWLRSNVTEAHPALMV